MGGGWVGWMCHLLSKNVGVIFFEKKIRLPQMIQKCLIQREMAKKIGGRLRFSAVAVVSPPFLRSSVINIIKATAIPKLTAVTHFFGWVPALVLMVSRSSTFVPLPPFNFFIFVRRDLGLLIEKLIVDLEIT